jgi:hypothetical protein
MANKKVSQLTSKPAVNLTDLFLIADPTSGQAFKTTISDLGTAIGSGVSSVNTLVGAVVLDTDDIQELVSPTNKWFTDTRARAAISAGTGISYNSGTGVITNAVTSGQIATALGYTPANGANYLALAGGTMGGAITGTIATFASSTSVTALGITLSGASGDGVKITHSAGRAFNIQSSGSGFGILINNETASTSAPFTIQKQGLAVITLTDTGAGSFSSSLTANSFIKSSGTSAQFLKADGSVDSTAYLPLAGGTLTGALNGTSATFTGDLTISSSNPRLYFTDTDNNPDFFISNTDGTFTIYDVTNSTSRFTIGTTGNATFTNAIIGNGSITGTALYSQGIISAGTSISAQNAFFDNGASNSIIQFNQSGTLKARLYFNTGANGLTLGTYNTGGNLRFEVDNNNLAATIASTGATTFNYALSGTSASFSSSVTGLKYIANSQATYASMTYEETIKYASSPAGIWFGNSFNSNNNVALQLRTSNDGTSVQALTLASTGAATFSSSVAIGASPSPWGSSFLGMQVNSAFSVFGYSNTNAELGSNFYFDGTNYKYTNTGTSSQIVFNGASMIFRFAANGSSGANLTWNPTVTMLSNGNVGINTSAPQGGAGANDRTLSINSGAGAASFLTGMVNGTKFSTLFTSSGSVALETHADIPLLLSTNNSEKVRITSAGRVFVNQTDLSAYADGKLSVFGEGAVPAATFKNAGNFQFTASFWNAGAGGGTQILCQFVWGSSPGVVGNITSNGSSVSYNTTSDYRLKEDLKTIKGLEIVNKIKVYDYKWKSQDSRMDGVLAHELAEVLPYAVSGIKDGEQMQGVDYSKIVPVMVQAIKDLKAELDTLKNK